MSEVEAQAVRRNEGAGLVDMIAQHLAQRGLQQMSCRVVAGHGQIAVLIYLNVDHIADAQGPFLNGRHEVYQAVRQGSGVRYDGLAFFSFQHARIAELAASFGMEGIVVDDDRHFFAVAGSRYFYAFLAQHNDSRFNGRRVVDQFALIQSRRIGRSHFRRHVFAGGAGPFLLFLHGGVEAGMVDGNAVFTGNFFSQLDRESVRVVQLEYVLAVQFLRRAGSGHELVEEFRPLGQRSAELRFFRIDNFFD